MTVGMDRQPDDRTSENRSFGSNYYPRSQSRKMSIGVAAGSSAKTRPYNVREDVTSTKGNINIINDKQIKEEVMAPTLSRQNEAPHQQTSPWISTRSSYKKVSSSEAICQEKQVSCLPSNTDMLKQSSGTKEAVKAHSVQFFENQMSILQPRDVKDKKFNRMVYQRKGGNDGTMGRVGDFSNATAQEVLVPEKELADDGENSRGNNGNETLRMKLWDILGTVSSPNKQDFNSKTLKTGANNSKLECISDEKASPAAKCRQHSDTIETDSQNHDHTIRRFLAQSLTRKKPQSKVSMKKIKDAPSYQHKQLDLEKCAFSFAEGCSQRLYGAASRASSMSKKKESEIKSSGIEPHKTCFPELSNADETQQVTNRRNAKNPAKKSLFPGNRKGSFNGSPSEKDNETVEPKNGMQEKDSHQSPVMEVTDQPGDIDIDEPVLQQNMDQQDPFGNHSSKNIEDPQYGLQSPTFELNTPIQSSSPSSLSSDQGELDADSPAERAFDMEGFRSFKSLLTSNEGHYHPNAKNLAGELEDSPVVESVPIVKDNHEENRRSRSACEEVDSESSEDGSPTTVTIMQDNDNENRWSRSTCEEVGSESSEDGSPIRGNEDSDEHHGPSEQDGEDGLASAVTLLALALERVKSKINSWTSRKAAEILMSVSENVHLQLQNAESQIQTDVEKLTSLGKSKRKHLEIRLQEQQEQLKHIYERFKEEVNHHAQDYRSTLEELEACQIEFKGMAKKQRYSHRKLLTQVDEEIQFQLNDVERTVTRVRKLGRENLLQLKHAIAECLENGDILS